MMIHPEIHAELARERTSVLLAEAEGARRVRQLRRPARGSGRPVRLRDGSAVLIRPVRPADDGLLAEGCYRLATSACLARTASAAVRRPSSSASVRSRSTTRRMPAAPISASTPR